MSDQKPNLDSLFEAAVEIESLTEQAAFLDRSCGDDAELREQIDQLLASNEQAEGFLEQPAVDLDATFLTSPAAGDRAASLEAGLAATFGEDAAVVLGNSGHSVLASLGQTVDMPRVVLRESQVEGDGPIARPKSPEMPRGDSDSRYRLDGEIARGGMGAIIKGRDIDLGRDLAIKVLLDSHKDRPEVIQRFVEEAQIGGQLQHPGIAPIYELGQFKDKRPFFAMKLVKGQTLSKLLADREDAAGERGKFIGIFEQVCQTMAYAHSRGVIHRDLKPANIMVGAFGEVQVMDWGLAKVLSSGGVADEKTAYHKQQGQSVIQTLRSGVGSDSPGVIGSVGSQTQMGSVMGTPAYMPPEQALGEIDQMDERADVFGLGAILSEILTGKPPYVAEDGTRVFRMASRGKLDDCFDRLETCGADADLIALAKHCLELEPADRPRDAGVLAERVTGYLESVEAKLRESEVERAAQAARADAEAAQAAAERQRAEAESQRAEAETAKAQAESARASEESRRRRTSLALAASVLLLAGVGSGGWLYLLRQEADRQTAEANAQREHADDMQRLAEERDSQRKVAVAAQQRESKLKDDAVAASQREADLRKVAEENEREAHRQKLYARRSLYSSSLFATQHALASQGGYSRAQELLENLRPLAGEADMRGWEWHFLNAQPDLSGFSIVGFSDYPIAVAFSPDGTRIATGDHAGLAKIFDSRTGRLQQVLLGHNRSVWSVAWNPTGTRLASASDDATARIWDVTTGQEIRKLVGHTGRVADVAWSPDGRQLVTGSFDNTVRTWNAETGSQLLNMTGHFGIRGVDWSRDGKLLASGGDRTVHIWDAATGHSIRVLEGHTSVVCGVQFSPDGRRIASASFWETSTKPVIVWNVETGEEEFTLDCFGSDIWWVRWSPDGRQLATTPFRGGITEIWNSQTGEREKSFPGTLYQCAWSPDGQRLATPGAGDSVRMWNVGRDKSSPEFQGHTDRIRTLAWSHDGTRIASASFDQTVKIWDVATKQELLTFAGHQQKAYCVDWAPDGKRLASCGAEQFFQIWEAETGRVLHTIRGADTLEMNALAWSPDGSLIATVADDSSVRIFDASSGQELQRMALSGYAISVDWSDDGRRLVAGGQGEWKAWDIDRQVIPGVDQNQIRLTVREIASFTQPEEKFWVTRFSPNGQQVVAGGEVAARQETFGTAATNSFATLSVWDVNSSEEIRRLTGHASTVRSACWTHDGSRLLTSGQDGKMILWDVETGQQLIAIEEPDENNVVTTQLSPGISLHTPKNVAERTVISAQFSPDELQIASAGDRPGIRLWDTTASHLEEYSPRLLPLLDRRVTQTPQFEDLVLRGRIRARLGEWDLAAADFEQARQLNDGISTIAPDWFETLWWVAGPYAPSSIETSPAEQQLDPTLPIPSLDGPDAEPDHWRMELLSTDGGLNLGRIYAGAENISSYAQTRIYCSKEQTIGLLVGVDDLAAIWLNGAPVFTSEAPTRAVRDDNCVMLSLEPGWNTVFAKVSNLTGPYGMYARLTTNPVDIALALDRHQLWEQSAPYWELVLNSSFEEASLLSTYCVAPLKSGDLETAETRIARGLELASSDDKSLLRAVAHAWHDAGIALRETSPEKAVRCFSKAKDIYEQLVLTESPIDSDAIGLADVLLASQQTDWSVLRPTDMTSAGGATLTLLEDGSVLASGTNAPRDKYHLQYVVPADIDLRSLRLEALTDPSLPANGPGRDTKGSFVLNQWQLTATPEEGGEARTLAFDAAVADYEYRDYPIKPSGWWSIDGGQSSSRVAIWQASDSPHLTRGTTLKLLLDFDRKERVTNLGRFRLAISDNSRAFDILTSQKITDPWARLAHAYHVVGAQQQLDQLLELHPEAKSFMDGLKWLRDLRASGVAFKSGKQLPDGTWELNLEGATITDLAILKGPPISRLNLRRTAVSDLTPLQGIPLKHLHLEGTQVSDLTPLQGMPLKHLNLEGTQVTDLTPLQGMPLEDLQLGHTAVSDLETLRGMPLKFLFVSNTGVTDLSPLIGMPLESLHLPNVKVSDVEPLRGMPLTSLKLHRCEELSDLSPLAECKDLKLLTLPPNAQDIEFLRTLPKLERISFSVDPNNGYRPDKTAEEFWKEYDAKKK